MNKLWLLLLLTIPCQSIHAQEVKSAPTEKDYFDRKLRCAEMASQVEKKWIAQGWGYGITQVQYSPSRDSCVVATQSVKGKRVQMTVEDILTDQTLRAGACTSDYTDCGKPSIEQGDLMRKLVTGSHSEFMPKEFMPKD